MIIVTKDQRIKFFGLSKFEGIFIREIATVHTGAVLTTDIT